MGLTLPPPVEAPASERTTTVRVVDPTADARWDAFVKAHPAARVFHLAAWSEILASAYRFEPASLALEDERGRIQGVLPAMYKAGPVSRRRIASLPLGFPGGPLTNSEADTTALLEAAAALADERGAVLRVRSRSVGCGGPPPGFRETPASPCWVLEVPADPDDLRRSWNPRSNVARNLRRAHATGLTVRAGRGEAELRTFYRLYLRTIRRHGSVPHSYRLLELSRRRLEPKGAFEVLLVEKDRRPLSGCVSYMLGDTLEPHFIANDPRFLDLRSSYALYWALICQASARGFRHIDFGVASEGGSQAAFKVQWSARPQPEFEYVHPEGPSLRPTTERALAVWRSRLASAAWSRMPMSISTAIGDIIRRYL